METYGRTDGRTYGLTDGGTDKNGKASCRPAPPASGKKYETSGKNKKKKMASVLLSASVERELVSLV